MGKISNFTVSDGVFVIPGHLRLNWGIVTKLNVLILACGNASCKGGPLCHRGHAKEQTCINEPECPTSNSLAGHFQPPPPSVGSLETARIILGPHISFELLFVNTFTVNFLVRRRRGEREAKRSRRTGRRRRRKLFFGRWKHVKKELV